MSLQNELMDSMFGSDDETENVDISTEVNPTSNIAETGLFVNPIVEVQPINAAGSQLGLFARTDLHPGVLILVRLI